MTNAPAHHREPTSSGNRSYLQIWWQSLLESRLERATAEADLATWLDRGIFVAVLLACGVALSLNVADPDLWGHVRYGQDALVHGLSATTTYSYVAKGYPWINHEIIAELGLATIANRFGESCLLLAKCLLGVLVVG